MIRKSEDKQAQKDPCAMYPVAEVKKLYEIQLMYYQAINYIKLLERENSQLKTEIRLLQQTSTVPQTGSNQSS